MLTSEEYAEKSGTECPNCGADSIFATDDLPWSDGPESIILCMRVACENCSAEWTEQYMLYGFDDLDTAEESEK